MRRNYVIRTLSKPLICAQKSQKSQIETPESAELLFAENAECVESQNVQNQQRRKCRIRGNRRNDIPKYKMR